MHISYVKFTKRGENRVKRNTNLKNKRTVNLHPFPSFKCGRLHHCKQLQLLSS